MNDQFVFSFSEVIQNLRNGVEYAPVIHEAQGKIYLPRTAYWAYLSTLNRRWRSNPTSQRSFRQMTTRFLSDLSLCRSLLHENDEQILKEVYDAVQS